MREFGGFRGFSPIKFTLVLLDQGAGGGAMAVRLAKRPCPALHFKVQPAAEAAVARRFYRAVEVGGGWCRFAGIDGVI